MKTIYTKALLTLLLVAAFAMGCKKSDLTTVNPNAQTTQTFWQNASDAVKGINAVYGSLIIDGSYMRFSPIVENTRGDDATSYSPWDQIYNMGKFNMQSTGAGVLFSWTAYYQGILRANEVLKYVPAINMDAELKKRVLGQAYFLRGLYYFHLADFYKNVPMPLVPAGSSADYFQKQQPQDVVWAQVISDFKAAEGMLPTTYSGLSPDGQIGRATKGAAAAFLGKTYLFTKKYAEAAAEFKSVIDMGTYSLVPNYYDNFFANNENNSESIFEVQFSRDAGGTDLGWGGDPSSGWGRTSARAITFGAASFGFTDVQPTPALYNEYLQEKTTSGGVDPRLDVTMYYNKPGEKLYNQDFSARYAGSSSLNALFCHKYENGDSGQADEYDWRSGINERLMRYADVLLMYAECLNELGQTNDAYQYIQRVRSRVGLPNLATVKPGMSQAEMRDQIGHERFLEFSLEGHRFDDIRRWGWLQDAAKLAWLKSRDPEFNTYTAGKEYLPIPLSEVQTNVGLVQNTGY
ncbi:RagB/SusD family nutrient uptake outer membrane protein [Mucilaginibacter gossypii]|uniref:RagB/SusD family nutrient uptake outer membrane protein n=1 Tax=Mucilaginibacter gossypii TaxID=551996 RepID=UPI000DCC1B8A|nr:MULTISPECIES: RagB/SusD family nutrient uptake outer membrane protein [Mucilaginibacter]QTE37667.1 RagB/SusD family nutrient uptake outer membrane protein [Mucilaginibacter gossypii]RAV46944.1 RagB/SusD family nutrient uptake outer membrane protein [Mucilaginibacter rubeus]